MRKMFEKMDRRNSIFAFAALGLIVAMIILSGGYLVAGGLAIAMAVPALTDDETAFVEQVKAEMRKEMEKFEKGYITQTKLDKFMSDQLKTALDAYSEKEVKALKEQINDLGIKLKGLEKGQDEKKEGILGKFFKDLIDKDSYDNRSHAAKTVIKAAALMTTGNITPETVGGFSPLWGNYIDNELGSVPKPDPVMMPLISVHFQPGTEKIYYSDRVNEEGDAAFIAEGALKPLADAEWQTLSAPIEEVAVRWKHTKRLANHAPSVITDFREHVNELMELQIDDSLIAGGGVAPEINGIEDVAAAFVAPTLLALSVATPNIYDAIIAVATQVRLANHKGALTCLLNTEWEAVMKSYKDANGNYIIPPFVTRDGKKVGEINVVFTNQTANTQITLGDLKKFHAVMAEEMTYDEGYENDDFSKNLVSKKLEAFLGTYIKASDVSAIVSDDIDTILTAITLPVV